MPGSSCRISQSDIVLRVLQRLCSSRHVQRSVCSTTLASEGASTEPQGCSTRRSRSWSWSTEIFRGGEHLQKKQGGHTYDTKHEYGSTNQQNSHIRRFVEVQQRPTERRIRRGWTVWEASPWLQTVGRLSNLGPGHLSHYLCTQTGEVLVWMHRAEELQEKTGGLLRSSDKSLKRHRSALCRVGPGLDVNRSASDSGVEPQIKSQTAF